jgi:hypothetical protein
MTERNNEDTTALLPDLGELANLVEHVKATGLAYCEPDDEGNIWTDLTVGWSNDTGEWSWQTGDNSFMGGAYHYPIWAVVSVGADTDAKATAKELHDQLEEQTW